MDKIFHRDTLVSGIRVKKKDEKKKDGSRTILGEREHILKFIFCVILSDVFLDNYLLMFRRSLMECEPGGSRGEE